MARRRVAAGRIASVLLIASRSLADHLYRLLARSLQAGEMSSTAGEPSFFSAVATLVGPDDRSR
jgi:hypothetical protein